MRKILTAALLAAFLLTVAGCGDDDTKDGATHNAADVAFAQQMIPHHQQAVEMAKLASSRASSPQVKDLTADIEAAQAPEIATMSGWLEKWGEDAAADKMSGMDHGDMGGSDMAGGEMPGMMTESAMADLEAATGDAFDRMFLTMMIEHHQGAIEMAQAEQDDGESRDAVALARQIEKAQTAEIATMKDLLGTLG